MEVTEFLTSECNHCPFCGAYVASREMPRHIEICPALMVKRSPQIAITPGREPYMEGELPPHLRQVIQQKTFLDQIDSEME